MMNKAVLYAIGIVMMVFTLMLGGALIYESIKGAAINEQAKKIKVDEKAVPLPVTPKDYSGYKTVVGGDGRKMVLIPAGIFPMGGGEEGDFDEQPQRIIFLNAYYIDQHEVANKDYKRFAQMLNRKMPEIPVFEDDIQVLMGDDQPVVGAAWVDAFAYCKWAGNRLPTEAEWEKAARGPEVSKWPWGNVFDSRLANGRDEEDGFAYTAPVGSFEQGRSFYGLYDMAGNVSEWVSDWYDQFYYKTGVLENPKGPDEPDLNKVLVYRGGSYVNIAHDLRASKRFGGAHPERGESTVGFRCARNIDE
jgi:formylglycine-generating enzyme required for sulfatase activity